MIFGIRKLESCGYCAAFLRDPTFSRFDTIPECDRHTHTDTQTYDDGIYHASIASRGKETLQRPNQAVGLHVCVCFSSLDDFPIYLFSKIFNPSQIKYSLATILGKNYFQKVSQNRPYISTVRVTVDCVSPTGR